MCLLGCHSTDRIEGISTDHLQVVSHFGRHDKGYLGGGIGYGSGSVGSTVLVGDAGRVGRCLNRTRTSSSSCNTTGTTHLIILVVILYILE